MRYSLFVPAIALGLAASVSAAPPPTAGSVSSCASGDYSHLARDRGKAAMNRLADLPPANLYIAVYRVINGCEAPIIAGYGYGAGGRRPITPPPR